MINQSPHSDKSGKRKIVTYRYAPVASGLSRRNAIKYLLNGIMSWNKHIGSMKTLLGLVVSYAQWK